MRNVFAMLAVLGFAVCGYSAACTTYTCDSLRVRTILDTNGLTDVTVAQVSTKSGNRIVTLNLSGRNVSIIPSQIGDISELTTLYIYNDTNIRCLPSEIGNLSKLVTFYAYNCRLDSLPADFKKLTLLQTIYIYSNSTLHALPDSIGKLTVLKTLRAYSCHLDSVPATINSCIKLQDLQLHSNNLYTIPSLSSIDSLKTLYLNSNHITSIPAFGSGQTKLATLYLYSNSLDSLPSTIRYLTGLTTLYVYSNSNLHSLPDSIGKLTVLKTLRAYSCHLDSVPATINSCIKLQDLQLHSNNLYTIPSLSSIDSLKTLYLNLNHITSIPSFGIGQTKLATLYLYSNSLDSLPSTIRYLTGLTTLYAYSNSSLHSLPDSIGSLSSLKYLNAYSCHLDSLPSSIGNLSSLKRLFVHVNSGLHNLPDSICKLTSLTYLNASSCHLDSLPANFGNLSNIDTLYLNSNQLTNLPASITAITPTAGYLNFGTNKICGPTIRIAAWLNFNDSDWKNTQTCSSTGMNFNLVGYWKMDEDSSWYCYDSSGYGNTGTFSGCSWDDGHSGSGVHFDAGTDYVYVPDNSLYHFGSNSFTVMCWAYIDTSTDKGARCLVTKHPNDIDKTFNLFANDCGGLGYPCGNVGLPEFVIRNNGRTAFVIATTPVSTGWHHIAAVRNSSKDSIFLYVDGTKVGQDYDSVGNIDNTEQLNFGDLDGGGYGEDALLGTIDEVRLYNTALTAAEIDSINDGLAKRGFTPHPRQVVHSTKEPPTTAGIISLGPNPSRSLVTIKYTVAGLKDANGKIVSIHTPVNIAIYSVTGKLVQTIVNDTKRSGYHVAVWGCRSSEGASVPMGMYFVRFLSQHVRQNWKLIVSK